MKVVQNGNKVLRQTAKEIAPTAIKSEEIRGILAKMAEAMDASENGVAIAAPQIGESLRIFLVDGNVWKGEAPVKEVKNQKSKNKSTIQNENPNNQYGKEAEKEQIKHPPIVFINPIIKKTSKKQQEVEEGCLSVDGVYGLIKRSEKVTVEALDENGKKFSRNCSDLLAQIIQHEMDHLNGILFIDKAKNLQKNQQEKN